MKIFTIFISLFLFSILMDLFMYKLMGEKMNFINYTSEFKTMTITEYIIIFVLFLLLMIKPIGYLWKKRKTQN
ncbi:hypothetical protein J5Y03_00235 [Bacillus sp. RG28]|uniref:Uncharacterized protein n=1 Tax=Gottfriedia endophytica TaxID=2820819 RepID=A0A940NLF8_9BACI|nr:hypothetical protein [Gottfriedia endophytica]MBP0723608.1 hypothetical protein [Gottfriedia endophytica]